MSYLGMIVFRGVYFGCYDTYKKHANNYIQKFLISYISTVAALTGIYPFDTIRRRLMMSSGQNYKYGSYKSFIKQIYKNHGITNGFFSGLPVIFL
jgi:solute carrier family 25 (adenine nucleotide translocator) protein 4/5/6/31